MVRIRRPDLRWGKEVLGSSSQRRSTPERKKHSISFGSSTGRPLPVILTGGKQLPAIGSGEARRGCESGSFSSSGE